MHLRIIQALFGQVLCITSALFAVHSYAPLWLCLLGTLFGLTMATCALASLRDNRLQTENDSRPVALSKLQKKIHQAESILNQREVTPDIDNKARNAIETSKRQLSDLEQVTDWRPFHLELINIYKLPDYVETLVSDCPRRPA